GERRQIYCKSVASAEKVPWYSGLAERGNKAGVAQLVEQLTCNQQVGGSIPSASSTSWREVFRELLAWFSYGGVPKWPTGSDCKSDGSAFVGSNPTPSTITFAGVV